MQIFIPGKGDKKENDEKAKKLEEQLNSFKNRMFERNIIDDSLSMFINQLERELYKFRSGDEQALSRAETLVDTIEERFKELEKEQEQREAADIQEQVAPEQVEEQPEQSVSEEPTQGEVSKAAEEIKEALQSITSEADEKAQKTTEEEKAAAEQLEVPEIPSQEQQVQEAQQELKEQQEVLPAEQTSEEKAEEVEVIESPPAEVTKPEETVVEEQTGFALGAFDSSRAEELFNNSIELIVNSMLDSGAIPKVANIKVHYIYPRDHLLATLGLIYAGRFEEAKKAIEFAFKGQNRHTGALPQRWDVHGNDASYRKVECDCTALLLYVFAEYIEKSSDYAFAEHYWEKAEKAVDFINSKLIPGKNLVLTPNSVHDYAPIDYGYEIWCNSLCVASFSKLNRIAEKLRVRYEPLDNENLIKEAIITYMWNSRLQTFVKTIKVEDAKAIIIGPDASTLALSFFRVFPLDDERIKGTVIFVEENLKYEALGGIRDYAEHYGREWTGVGANPLFTAMLADYYIGISEREKAEQYIKWLCSAAFENKLPKYIASKQDFEALVSDLNDAGLLDRETLALIESTRKHEDYANGYAHIMEPYLPAHGIFAVAWSRYKEKFG